MVATDDLGVAAHCARTAAIAGLVAHHLFLPSEQKEILQEACLLHHRSTGLCAPNRMGKLWDDLFTASPGPPVLPADCVPVAVRGILNAYGTPGIGDPMERRLGGILRLTDAFDQGMEARPIEGTDAAGILERLREGVAAGLWLPEAMDALIQSTQPVRLPTPDASKVPVFPQAAMRMLQLIHGSFTGIAQVVEAASLDPATAGLVMQLANSALFGARTRISTLSHAILRLGFAATLRVVTTAALRPLFRSPRLEELWPHCLEVADLSHQLASRTGTADPGEAYLAGLVHDAGRIALVSLPLYDSARLEGLTNKGCPQLYAEDLLLRTNHEEIGAEIAGQWRLPEEMIAAIGSHHHPEKMRSPLAPVLYLAEYLSGAEEDLPSIVRLEAVLREIKLDWGELQEVTVSEVGQWLAAA